MGDAAEEADRPVGYSKRHYPNGLNSNFLIDDVDELRTSYSGKGIGSSRPGRALSKYVVLDHSMCTVSGIPCFKINVCTQLC